MILACSYSPVFHWHAFGIVCICSDLAKSYFFYDDCVGMTDVSLILKAVDLDSYVRFQSCQSEEA